MGACNGYWYHDLRPDRNVPSREQVEAPLSYPEREADEEMLAEIADKPEVEEMY